MRVIPSILFATVLTVFLQTAVAQNQNRFSLEFRTGVNIPTQKFGDADLETGIGLEGTLAYQFIYDLSVYGGWSWNRFTAENSFAGTDIDLVETGYRFGLQCFKPLGSTLHNYFIHSGGIYNHIEIENRDGDVTGDSDHGLGWEAGAGVAFSLGENWKLMPGIRYRVLSRDIEVEDNVTGTDLTYLSGSFSVLFIF